MKKIVVKYYREEAKIQDVRVFYSYKELVDWIITQSDLEPIKLIDVKYYKLKRRA